MTREVNYFKKSPPGAWVKDAACRGIHGVHFPDAPLNTQEYKQQVAFAQSICARCPVQQPCLELALSNREREGVWGGIEFEASARGRRRLAIRILNASA